MTASEGVVVKYNKQRATFRIRYQGFERKMDVEDVDMSTLEDILIMGPKYGDQRAEWGKTRDECRRAAVYAVIMQEAWEEITHNNVPYYNQTEESQLGGAACYAATEGKPVIFDDEPRNPSELAKHPEKEDILVSAAKEIEMLSKRGIVFYNARWCTRENMLLRMEKNDFSNGSHDLLLWAQVSEKVGKLLTAHFRQRWPFRLSDY